MLTVNIHEAKTHLSRLIESAAHAAAVTVLPLLHKDPFDRLLVAQAMAEGLVLVTVDPLIARYPGAVRRV